MNTKFVKKLVSVICSAALMLTAASTMMFTSVSAETYDYYSIFSADAGELPIVYSPNNHCKYEIVDDTVRNDGGKIVKVTKNGQYNNEPNIAFKQDFSKLAKDSVGIRVFLAKSVDATAGNLVSFGFGSTVTDKTYIDTGIWGTANNGNCTTEGSWYEFYWDNTTGLSTATLYDNTSSNSGYRVVPASQTISADNKIDADFISGMDSVYIRWNLNATTGHYAPNYYLFDDVQFIYPEGKAPSSSTVETTDIISTQTGASIRLKDDGTNGIRFYSTFDETKAAEQGVTAAGTLIAPKNLVDENGGELTKDIGEANYLDVKYDLTKGLYTYNNETKYVVGSIVNIQDKNINREFVARGYVVIDGVTYYSVTTSLDADNNGRSIKYIANAFRDDYTNNKLSGEDKAKYEANKTLIDGWANYGSSTSAE